MSEIAPSPDLRLAVIVLAAGHGTRMRSRLPKVLHRLAGKPMLNHVLDAVAELTPARTVVVAGPGMPAVEAAAAPYAVAIQHDRLGTAHAVLTARTQFDSGIAPDAVLIVYGDTPLIRPATLAEMIRKLRQESAAAVVLAMRPRDPGGYGRLVLGPMGGVERIVEAADATAEERAIPLCNSGVMAISGARIWDLLDRVGTANAKQEYYLTDLVGLARADGLPVKVVEASEFDVAGVNSRADLAAAEAILQARLRAAAMAGGATLIDPATVYFAVDTVVGRDVTIGPSVVFGPGVTIEDEVEIRAFCHIEGARVARGAVIGPFARLRPGAEIGAGAHVGNFVELKNAVLGARAKANHLTYLGDCSVGAGANIGAGTITCNYDGFAKHRTEIGAQAFIGSDVALVAPVRVGDRATVAAGSVVTEDVPDDALAIARGRQAVKPGWSAEFRSARQVVK